jgi:hypothetical protein
VNLARIRLALSITAVLVAATLLASCTSAPPASLSRSGSSSLPAAHPALSRRPAAPHPTAVWRSAGFRPVSSVRVVGPTAVVYGVIGNRLYLIGLDASTGALRWRNPASGSATTWGVGLDVSAIDGGIAYFGPLTNRSGAARLIIADAAAGRTIRQSAPMEWVDHPDRCDPEDDSPCASLYDRGGDEQFRLDRHTGRLTAVGGPERGYRHVGDELVDPGTRQPDILARMKGTRFVWAHPLAGVFAKGVSTDNGWDFRKFGTTYVGTVYRPLAISQRRRTVTLALGKIPVTAGFRVSDGVTLWRSIGTSIDCMGALSNGDDADPVRCRYTGSVTYHYPPAGKRGRIRTTASRLSVTVEGFDPATERTTWSHRLGAALQLTDGGAPTVIASDHALVIPTPHGREILDRRTGALHPVPSGASFWCSYSADFSLPVAGGTPQRRSATVYGPCTANGTSMPTRVPATVPGVIATEGPQGLRLVSTRIRVVAYRT